MLCILVQGSNPTEVKMSAMIVVSIGLPAMTQDEFFAKNIVENLANFLGISADKIKVSFPVAETRRRRRKRSETLQVCRTSKE